MKFHLHWTRLPGLIAAALIALPSAAGIARSPASLTPALTYSRYDRNPMPGTGSRIGVGVEPRIGIGVEPRTGIGADTGVNVQKFIAESPTGVLSPSEAENPSTVREAQQALSADGLAPDTNGIVGPRTRQAIRAYQRNHNLPVTGVLDNETRQSLGLP